MSGGEWAGTLGERVSIRRRAATRDDLGGADGAWQSVGIAWAALSPAGGGAAGAGDLASGAARWKASLRTGVDVAAEDRLVWRGLTLAVLTVTADPATPDRVTLTLEEVR